MQDIENLDIENTKIENPYSKNSFWKKSSSTENIDVEEFEYNQKLKEYNENKIKLKILIFIDTYKLNMFGFVFVCSMMFLMSAICLACVVILYIDKNLKETGTVLMCGEIFFLLGIYVLNEVQKLKKANIYKKMKSYKDICKYIKNNRKQIRAWARTIVPPPKPEDISDEEYWN